VSSYNNLNSVSKTLATHIWDGIKDDPQTKAIIQNPRQISYLSPKETRTELAQISVFLYNVTELSSMRNQPQTTQNPHTLLYLNLHYLITPLTQNAENDQIILGKIMQLFAETPILRGSNLQGSLLESGDELKIILDSPGPDDLNKLWIMLQTPYKLCISYSVFPIRIESSTKIDEKPVIIKKPKLQDKKNNGKGLEI
jgi:hypothetical protein